ncbi:MAG: hypothetical protein P4M11_12090 [Candidatus Pacebacteria bacterium]|nr:hypothetical protein [Candidatus Paceibacterota bacterium]
MLRKCNCTPLLIVDDNDYNLFVLQSYCSIINISADIVSASNMLPL